MLRLHLATGGLALAMNLLLSACGGGGGGGVPDTGGGGPSGGPDIVVTGFTGVPTATLNSTHQVSFTVANAGGTAGSFVPRVDLGPDPDLRIDAFFIGMQTSLVILNPGQSTTVTLSVKIPDNLGTGTYYMGPVLDVAGDVDPANNTRSAAVSIAGLACADDIYEADNRPAAAKLLQLGQPQLHNHCNGSSDWVQFDAAAGTTYGFNTTDLGMDAWALLRVYDADGATVLASSNRSIDGVRPQRLTWTATRTGTFYLRAYPAVPTSSVGPDTDYVLGFGDLRPDLVPGSVYAGYQVYAGGTTDTSVEVQNIGFAASAPTKLTWYLSNDAVITTADLPLLTVDVSALGAEQSFMQYSTPVPVPGTVMPGDYYIGVIVNPDQSLDEYAFVNNATVGKPIQVFGLTNCTPDQYEEDDTIGAANAILVGADAQQRNLCDDGIDWLTFDATAGVSYHISSNEGYSVIAPDQTTTLTLDSNGNFTTAESGTHYIRVRSGFYANQGGNYNIKLDPALPDLAFYSMLNPTPSAIYAGGWVDVSMTLQNKGYLPSAGYEWSIHRSDNPAPDTTAPLVASGSMPSLVNGSYGTMAYVTTRVYFDKDMTPGNYYLVGALDRAGAIAEVREDNNLSPISTITVSAPPCAVDAFEDDDSLAAATDIPEATTQTRNHCDDLVDWVRFVAPADGVYLASAIRAGGSSPRVDVMEADGATPAQIQVSDDIVKSDGVPWQTSWNAVSGNTYYLKLDNTSKFSNGNYALTVKRCAIDEFEDDDNVASAGIAAFGVLQARNHCEDDNDWVRFDAIQGTSYTIVATNVGTASKVAIDLYDTNGTSRLIWGGTSFQGGKGREISGWVAPATGTYYIRLYQDFANGWGENTGYTLQIN